MSTSDAPRPSGALARSMASPQGCGSRGETIEAISDLRELLVEEDLLLPDDTTR
ncbi:MAG: hypothetical protein JO161_00615 [Planctomycetaceae bacterium]|jgi:hypothetical protein|nr:hypothetical protein [Planctomycetaceae bacterium]